MGLVNKKKTGAKTKNQKTGQEGVNLLESEMMKMDNLILSDRLVKSDITIGQLQINVKRLEIQKLEVECNELAKGMNIHKSKISINKEERAKFISGLQTKYNIKSDKFGYNPDTGLILEE